MAFELYRHFDKEGVLVYVGMSTNTLRRTVDHESGSTWFNQVVRIEIERFPSRAEALAAEDAAIQEEKPLMNLRYGRKYGPASRNTTDQETFEADLAEAKAKGIKVRRNRWIRYQIEAAEKGIEYPYDIKQRFEWESRQAKKKRRKKPVSRRDTQGI